MTDNLSISHDDRHVVTISINRPEHFNVIDEDTANELRDNLRKLSKDSSIRPMVLTAEGEHFCRSVDPKWIQTYQNNNVDQDNDPGSKVFTILTELDNFPTPVIAAIRGDALGVGAAMAACSDIVVCESHSRFAINEVRAGLAPIASAPYIMSCIGAHNTRRWLLSGEYMTSDQAVEMGLAHINVDAENFEATVADQVDSVLKGVTSAQKETKQFIKDVCIHGHHESAAFQRSSGVMFKRCLNSREAKKGISDWVENKQAPWDS